MLFYDVAHFYSIIINILKYFIFRGHKRQKREKMGEITLQDRWMHALEGRSGRRQGKINLAVLFDPSTGKGSGPFLLYLYSPLLFSTH